MARVVQAEVRGDDQTVVWVTIKMQQDSEAVAQAHNCSDALVAIRDGGAALLLRLAFEAFSGNMEGRVILTSTLFSTSFRHGSPSTGCSTRVSTATAREPLPAVRMAVIRVSGRNGASPTFLHGLRRHPYLPTTFAGREMRH